MAKHADYVIMNNQVFRRIDKEPFGSSGFSLYGAVEYDKEHRLLRCHECGDYFRVGGLGLHIAKSARHPDLLTYKRRHGLTKSHGLGASPETPGRIPSRPPSDTAREKAIATTKTRAEARRQARIAGVSVEPIPRIEFRNVNGTCPIQVPTVFHGIAARLKRTPTYDDLPPGVAAQAVRKHGSFSAALIAMGFKPNKIGEYPAESLLPFLIDFYALNGRIPFSTEFGRGNLPSRACYSRVFGSLRTAYEAAGLGLQYRRPGPRSGRAHVKNTHTGKPPATTAPGASSPSGDPTL